jgi:hypothetical protein
MSLQTYERAEPIVIAVGVLSVAVSLIAMVLL